MKITLWLIQNKRKNNYPACSLIKDKKIIFSRRNESVACSTSAASEWLLPLWRSRNEDKLHDNVSFIRIIKDKNYFGVVHLSHHFFVSLPQKKNYFGEQVQAGGGGYSKIFFSTRAESSTFFKDYDKLSDCVLT